LSDLAHLAGIVEQIQRLQQVGVSEAGLDLRLTPLDPGRPARDVLEDLLSAVRGGFTLWCECPDTYDDPDRGLPEEPEDAANSDEDELDDLREERDVQRFTQQLGAAIVAAGAPN
jgi:hypothetical protein